MRYMKERRPTSCRAVGVGGVGWVGSGFIACRPHRPMEAADVKILSFMRMVEHPGIHYVLESISSLLLSNAG